MTIINQYFLIYACSEYNLIHSEGRRLIIPIGGVILLKRRAEFHLSLHHELQKSYILIPYDILSVWVPYPEALTGKNLSTIIPWGGVLANYLVQIKACTQVKKRYPCFLIMSQICGLLKHIAIELADSNDIYEPRVDKIIQLLEKKHTQRLLTVACIAKELGISVRTLQRDLSHHGKSFNSEVIRLRLLSAQKMLLSSDFDRLPIENIARRAGFTDPSHLTRLFKSKLGYTPGQLRKKRLNVIKK